ncbi:amidohydrolase family protein [Sphingorhabdus sp. Alg239-R122]|uniref:metal-dependent hydrolase family protein n=1 Tax=Sphingorhabdus sp. Alg239-R122 TaxID=2305989 RepID=UPI0013DBEF0D|nr:amidohydrolase family protein [Sphingorhabdus sp. Alg239-R122]
MRTLTQIWAAFLALTLMVFPAAAQDKVILAGNLIADANTGATGPATITVRDGRIVSIESGITRPNDGKVIDLSDKTVLPGLIDMHVHLSGDPGGDFWRQATEPDEWGVVVGAKNARLTALAGFTTVRDVGSAPQVGFVLRRGTAEGILPGPRIQSAGSSLAIIGGHGDVSGFRPEVNAALADGSACTGVKECAAAVREASKNGADLIKITATGGVLSQQARGLDQHFTDAEMEAIVSSAHALGMRVAAHAHGPRGIEAASKAGVDTIEHCTFADDATIRAMKENGTACVPTLMAFVGVQEGLGKGVYTPPVEAKIRATLSQLGKAPTAMRKAGIPIIFGTDSGVYPHGRNAEEFALMIKHIGMSPREVLASATTEAAKLMDLENEIGRIATGYSADIIAVDSDPLKDITALEKVDWVMVRGKVID